MIEFKLILDVWLPTTNDSIALGISRTWPVLPRLGETINVTILEECTEEVRQVWYEYDGSIIVSMGRYECTDAADFKKVKATLAAAGWMWHSFHGFVPMPGTKPVATNQRRG